MKTFCSALGTLMLMTLSLINISNSAEAGIFGAYRMQAEQQLTTMSQEEKITQILLVRYPDRDGVLELAKHQFGGYLFFAKDFASKSPTEVRTMINQLQEVAKIPILTAVDEEGGAVVRVSSNPQLAKQKFPSPQQLYAQGGLPAIQQDTVDKSRLLRSLGINLNLAPVVDVSTNPDDYMYTRSLGEDTKATTDYARAVITASRGGGVSYTLKHFPGYGNNSDTHTGDSVDQRTYEELAARDLPPFVAGIEAGAEAVLVSHNIVNSIDPQRPASLSPAIHELLRRDLDFTGIIITDDIAMGAITDQPNATVQALLAGNDLIITTDYRASIRELTTALSDGTVTSAQLNRAVLKVLAWKYYKGLL